MAYEERKQVGLVGACTMKGFFLRCFSSGERTQACKVWDSDEHLQ
jgi:hypothetical protein